MGEGEWGELYPVFYFGVLEYFYFAVPFTLVGELFWELSVSFTKTIIDY